MQRQFYTVSQKSSRAYTQLMVISYLNKCCELKQRFLHVRHGIDQTFIDNATDEWHGRLRVRGQKADTSSNYCDNIMYNGLAGEQVHVGKKFMPAY